MNFGKALEEAKNGRLIAREGWNGKNMFVFMRPGDYAAPSVAVNFKSLPESVKKWLHSYKLENGDNQIYFTPYLCLKAADNSIVNGWNASQTDMMAEDWFVFEKNYEVFY
ncbi:MAG: DUF2829 domain-containing protein [bacterium]|nr:DUF2829 domain-containing protein [bacterium]